VGAKVGVEAIERLGVQLPQRDVPQGRQDVAADVALVPVPRAQLEVGHFEPAGQQVPDGPAGGGGALPVDLGEEPREGLLGFGIGPGRLAEVAGLLGDRVASRVDVRAEGAVAAELDVPSAAALLGHVRRITFIAKRIARP
jgi:hypothetical protein